MNIFNKVTLKTLKQNKTRTVVTIIGIVLSTALITAVTTFGSSIQSCLLQNAIEANGDWYGALDSVDKSESNEIKNNKEVTQTASNQNIGYSLLKDSMNKSKPYLNIIGVDGAFEKTMSIHITSGRMPQNASEIILPEHLLDNGGIKYDLQNTMELEIGQRVLDGEVLDQNVRYMSEKSNSKAEEFVVKEKRNYTVVGFYKRPAFETYMSPGYTAITVMDQNMSDSASYNIYFKMKNPVDTSDFLQTYEAKNIKTEYNTGVLRFLGASQYSSINKAISHIFLIVAVIMLGGSVLLIYNSFAISVSERTKQFGLLSSIGATRKQIGRSVLFEALFVSVIGIPLGILVGIAGIGITLFCIKDKMEGIILGMFNGTIPLTLHIEYWAIAVAVALALITVLISAFIPSRRAMRTSAIAAIQQSTDIKIKGKKLRTHKWIYKVFGFEGALAQKNFKRSKKKYRTTVISLFMSVVLFVSASSVCMYLLKTSSESFETRGYEIRYSYTEPEEGKSGLSLAELTQKLSGLKDVNQISEIKDLYGTIKGQKELFSDRYIADTKFSKGETASQTVILYEVDDHSFEKYLKEHDLSKAKYMNPANPVLIARATNKIKDSETGKLAHYKIFKEDELNLTVTISNHTTKTTTIKSQDVNLNIGLITDDMVIGASQNYVGWVYIMIPHSLVKSVSDSNLFGDTAEIFISTDAHASVTAEAKQMLKDNGISTDNLYDSAQEDEYNKNMIFVIQVFAYGFITLISLIAMANVFNTISTNILLRRREFAMLKSVGMTQRGFNKMMNFECLLYGVKSLLLGLPVSIAITYWIYTSIGESYEISFMLPWKAMGISVFSVFAVVFVTMLYAMSRIKKDNPIDALKNENL